MRRYRHGIARRGANAFVARFIRLGVVPRSAYLLTTRGRKSGQPRTNPVQIVRHDGHRWLVAPYGTVSWVHNARASGTVTLSRGGTSDEFSVVEVEPRLAAPVLKRYVALAPVVLPYFEAGIASPVEAYEAEAAMHPVFLLTPKGGGS